MNIFVANATSLQGSTLYFFRMRLYILFTNARSERSPPIAFIVLPATNMYEVQLTSVNFALAGPTKLVELRSRKKKPHITDSFGSPDSSMPPNQMCTCFLCV